MTPEETIPFITNLLSSIEDSLDVESIESITHYLNHDEYEMAYEILLLEIMDKGMPIDSPSEVLEIARILQLDKETVYDNNLWDKLNSYLNKI